jgi:hypothetical protein
MKNKMTVPVFLSLATSLGLILFWGAFFTVGMAPANPPACYFAYEHSFPLPDILLAVALLAWALLELRGKGSAALRSAAGGALIFLGVLDISFNAQNGVYASSMMDMISNAFINVWCVLFGLYMARGKY